MNKISQVRQGKEIEYADGSFVFDKVINLKFIRRLAGNTGEKESFTIRSDYDINYREDGTYYFSRMAYKPEIKVQYEQVADNTAISIKIYVTNFHMYGLGGDKPIDLSAVYNPIESIVVQLGYFAQFPDFTDPNSKLKLQDYLDLGGGLGQNSAGVPVKELTCQVLSAYPISLPPDSVTLFDCVVGTVGYDFHTAQDKDDPDRKVEKGTTVKDYFYKYITKRFLRSTPTKEILDSLTFDTEHKGEYPGSLKDVWADKYGVVCHLSDKISSTEFPASTAAPNKFNNVNSTLSDIQKRLFPNMRSFACYNGDYVIFDRSENILDVINSAAIQAMNKDTVPVIPAVYTITLGAIRSISCPFFSLVNPFQTLQFLSRYNMSNLVGYYYSPKEGDDTFYSIRCTISFSTCGTENEMLITSVDRPEGS